MDGKLETCLALSGSIVTKGSTFARVLSPPGQLPQLPQADCLLRLAKFQVRQAR